jgi:hypothetical protein
MAYISIKKIFTLHKVTQQTDLLSGLSLPVQGGFVKTVQGTGMQNYPTFKILNRLSMG